MRKIFILLFLVFLIPRLSLIEYIPLKLDECLYAIMIEEQAETLTLVPTFFGYAVWWKPPVFFWVMSFFAQLLRPMSFLSIEAFYRLPNVLFGFINTVLVYLVAKHITKDEKFALVNGFVFALLPLTILVDTSLLIDPLNLMFILASVYLYLLGEKKNGLFFAGGVFSFLAVLTKLFNALSIPIIIAAYFFQHNRKVLRKREFLLSLLFIPAAFLVNYAVYEDKAQASEMLLDSFQNKIVGHLSSLSFIYASVYPLFALTGVWLALALVGFFKYWKRELVYAAWFALIIFPLVGGTWMVWYFLPIMPPMVYFASLALAKDEKGKTNTDKFFLVVFALIVLISILLSSIIFATLNEAHTPKKLAGEFIASKENVLIIGEYGPGIFAYKVLEEKKAGEVLDFGLVIVLDNNSMIEEFIDDYYGPSGENIRDGNFGPMFYESGIYRKDTNLTEFDYVVLSNLEEMKLNGSIVFNEGNVTIYKIK